MKASAQVKYESVQHALDKVEFTENENKRKAIQNPPEEQWTESDHKKLLASIDLQQKQWDKIQAHVASRDYHQIS